MTFRLPNSCKVYANSISVKKITEFSFYISTVPTYCPDCTNPGHQGIKGNEKADESTVNRLSLHETKAHIYMLNSLVTVESIIMIENL